ncbi:MAG TPA: hypothetical protein VGG25_16590 [Streptosporangiaceae bacterium]|jgi:hypothetical protein
MLAAARWRASRLLAVIRRWLVVAGLVVVCRVVVCWPVGLAGVGGRGYRGQGAQQEPEVDVGAQQVGAAAGSGGFEGAGEGGDPGHRGGRVRGGQAGAGEGGSAVVVGVQADPRPPLRRLAPLFRSLRVGDDHRPAEAGAELGVGEFPGLGQHVVLDAAGGVLIQQAGGLDDEPGAVRINLPAGQRRPGTRQPPGQGHGLPGPPLGGPR